MKPVVQTKRGGPNVPPQERGDCWSAGLASVLELPIDAVPIPHSDDPDYHWWDATQAALRVHGFEAVVASPKIYPYGYWLAGVPSLNLGHHEDGKPVKHLIVMRDGLVVHDPAISENRYAVGTPVGELDVIDAYVLVPLDPARARRALVGKAEAA